MFVVQTNNGLYGGQYEVEPVEGASRFVAKIVNISRIEEPSLRYTVIPVSPVFQSGCTGVSPAEAISKLVVLFTRWAHQWTN